MQNVDYGSGDGMPMETAGEPGQSAPGETRQPECKFSGAALEEMKRQIADLQDLFVRRLYDDKQKAALINSLEEKASFAYIEPFVSDMILVLDRLEKAGPENLGFAASIADELYEILSRRGLERIKVTQKFDPATGILN